MKKKGEALIQTEQDQGTRRNGSLEGKLACSEPPKCISYQDWVRASGRDIINRPAHLRAERSWRRNQIFFVLRLLLGLPIPALRCGMYSLESLIDKLRHMVKG
jgi:hypothetical protein